MLSHEWIKMTMSSKYALANPFSPLSSWSTILWKVADAPCKPNGILQNWYNLNGVTKAVLGWSCLLTGTRQYPLVKSNALKHLALPTSSMMSSTCGIG